MLQNVAEIEYFLYSPLLPLDLNTFPQMHQERAGQRSEVTVSYIYLLIVNATEVNEVRMHDCTLARARVCVPWARPGCLRVSLFNLARVTARTGDNLTGGCDARAAERRGTTVMEGENTGE